MKRERNIITIDERGRLNIPTDTASVWMTEAEIVELFGTTAGVVSSAIKTIIKSDALNDYEVCKCIRLDSGNNTDVYNMEVVVEYLPYVGFQKVAGKDGHRTPTHDTSDCHSI